MKAVYTYIHTPDFGQELRYSLRSISNLTNFDGDVFIVGESELWLKNVTYLPVKRLYGNPNVDVQKKLRAVVDDPRIPDEFILMMDDVYITEKIAAIDMHRGDLTGNNENTYQMSKLKTLEFLKNNVTETRFDYETHAPFICNKKRLSTVLDIVDGTILQWRSIYGNIFEIGGELFEDMKTKSSKLPPGSIISTQFYTDELDKLFPKESIYENSVLR